jgi:hypothetical protein
MNSKELEGRGPIGPHFEVRAQMLPRGTPVNHKNKKLRTTSVQA